MKLYYFADGCSLASHIALREAGMPVDLVKVDVVTRITDAGQPFAQVNPKGYVPALVFDDGSRLTENVALLDWIAQQSPALRPAEGEARTRQIEALAFVSTEIHKMFLALFFLPGDEAKPVVAEAISGRFAHIAERLDGAYLLGGRFSVADAFAYVMLRWAMMSDMSLPERLVAYAQGIEARPAVQAALAAEGVERRFAA